MQNLETIIARLKGYFSFNGYLVPQAEAEQTIREGVSFRGTNILILVFAILIASLGLNTNSTAVIIGAMLISPLMGPIIGLGLGIGIEDFDLLKRSMRNLVVAALFSVLASTVYFLISPVSEGHSELLARTSPTIYDVLIGFFGGAAGIFAIASKSKGNVIPGVAIATALMPPLCTVGYGLATFQMHYFLGALYLFLINSIYIGLATFIGVKLMHFQRTPTSVPERAKRMRHIVYTTAILTLLPSIYLTYNMLRMENFQQEASRFVADEFQFPQTQVLSHTATYRKGGTHRQRDTDRQSPPAGFSRTGHVGQTAILRPAGSQAQHNAGRLRPGRIADSGPLREGNLRDGPDVAHAPAAGNRFAARRDSHAPRERLHLGPARPGAEGDIPAGGGNRRDTRRVRQHSHRQPGYRQHRPRALLSAIARSVAKRALALPGRAPARKNCETGNRTGHSSRQAGEIIGINLDNWEFWEFEGFC